MVLYITTWQEAPDDNQKESMNTNPKWFIEFENKQEQCWKEQHEFNKKQQEFNQQILGLSKLIVKRIDNLIVKNNLKE